MISLSKALQRLSPFRDDYLNPTSTTHLEKRLSPTETSNYKPDSVIVMDQDLALQPPEAYQPLNIPPLEKFPKAAESATPSEEKIHDMAIAAMHQHAEGLTEAFYNHYAKLGWVSEQMAFFDPRVREYIGKPGSLHDQMHEIVSGLNLFGSNSPPLAA